MTRNPESDKAKAVAAIGVELVKGDLSDKESVKVTHTHTFLTIQRALKGAYGAFLVTDYWANPDDFDAEVHQGINFIDASKEEKLSHLVFR